MSSKKVLIVIALLTFVLTLANSVLLVCDAFLYSIDDIPQGEFLRATSKSVGMPEERTINVYVVENSLGKGVRCTASQKDGEERNIYWQVGIEDVTIEWVDANRAIIRAEGVEDANLDLDIDSYDCRAVIEESIPVVEIVKSK